MIKYITALLILALSSVVNAQTPFNFVMKPQAWIQYHNTPTDALDRSAPMVINANGALAEGIPQCALNQRPNYLIAPMYGKNINQYKYVTFTVGITNTSGNPQFVFASPTNSCKVGCNPVSVKVMIWGPDANNSSLTNRWWAWLKPEDMFVLKQGKATITVPLDGSHFGGVSDGAIGMNKNGKVNPYFILSKSHVYAMGLTFGGGFYAGHGTCVQGGTASFQLYNYSLN